MSRPVPYCTILFVVLSLICHSLVLWGNLGMTAAMQDLASSSKAWSDVGLGLSSALNSDLDVQLANITAILTSATQLISDVQLSLDGLVASSGDGADAVLKLLMASASQTVVGVAMDNSTTMSGTLMNLTHAEDSTNETQIESWLHAILVHQLAAHSPSDHLPSLDELRNYLKDGLTTVVGRLVGAVDRKLQALLALLKPPLLQIRTWLSSFGDSVQAMVETFIAAIDKVQQLFDALMQRASMQGTGKDHLLEHTFAVFDCEGRGSISVQDLSTTAESYGLDAFAGNKSRQLHAQYDADHDGHLSKAEFRLMVDDPSIPNAMSTVLRTYAKKLSKIAGQVAAARVRDEIAAAVAHYFMLVSAKNYTKVLWVSSALTNRSLPMEFAADVLKELAAAEEDPDKSAPRKKDAGFIVFEAMYNLDAAYASEIVQLMADPAFWSAEGFDPSEHARVMERVSTWLVTSGRRNARAVSPTAQRSGRFSSFEVHPSSRGTAHRRFSTSTTWSTPSGFAAPAQALVRDVPRRVAMLLQRRSEERISRGHVQVSEKLARLYTSSGSVQLRDSLFGAPASSAARQQIVDMVVKSGQPAAPQTLEFAKFLAWNASDTADRFQRYCFDYSRTSSNTLDSLAVDFQAMVKKIQTFLKHVESYASPGGVAQLETKIHAFSSLATDEIVSAAMAYVDAAVAKLNHKGWQGFAPHAASIKLLPRSQIDNTLDEIRSELHDIQSVLPGVVGNLKDARKEVSAVAWHQWSVFSVFKVKGPWIFTSLANSYFAFWVAYYVLLVFLTLLLLLFGISAAGTLEDDEGCDIFHEEPRSFRDKFKAVVAALYLSVDRENPARFWSVIVAFEVVLLLLFFVSVALCVFAAVKSFMLEGCTRVYILADASICRSALGFVKQFLPTLKSASGLQLDDMCTEHGLLTCYAIGEKLKQSVYLITGASILATVFTFEVVLQSVVTHERYRYKKLLELQGIKRD